MNLNVLVVIKGQLNDNPIVQERTCRNYMTKPIGYKLDFPTYCGLITIYCPLFEIDNICDQLEMEYIHGY